MDWTDLESFSRPPPRGTSDCADPEASWGHRKNNLLHDEDELFYGYYLSDAIIGPGRARAASPELARRMTVSSCRHDPVPALAPVLTAMTAAGIPLGDVLADSGYSHRVPRHWATPLRAAGASLVQDLHPHDRGPGSPPTTRTATTACSAPRSRARSAAAPAPSMTLNRPEILAPPEHPQACCTQQTITVPADVAAKTRQKHDYPSAAWRRSYNRRTGAERAFATVKDPASNDISRGWCRLMGLAPLMLFTTALLLVVRNQRILTARDARQDENARRAARGLPPRTRKRRRKTPAALTAAAPP